MKTGASDQERETPRRTIKASLIMYVCEGKHPGGERRPEEAEGEEQPGVGAGEGSRRPRRVRRRFDRSPARKRVAAWR